VDLKGGGVFRHESMIAVASEAYQKTCQLAFNKGLGVMLI
jgi:hypothetical protein